MTQKNLNELPSSRQVVPRPHTISLIRIPHGYFKGGVTEANVIPPITTSSYEWNTLILCEY